MEEIKESKQGDVILEDENTETESDLEEPVKDENINTDDTEEVKAVEDENINADDTEEVKAVEDVSDNSDVEQVSVNDIDTEKIEADCVKDALDDLIDKEESVSGELLPVEEAKFVATVVEDKKTKFSKKNKKKIIGIIAASVAVVLLIGAALLIHSQRLESISFDKSAITIKEGETTKLSWEYEPSTANLENYDMNMKCSDGNVLSFIDEYGKVKGLKEGTCTVSIEVDGKEVDTCTVTVESNIPDFKTIYDRLEAPAYMDVASDGSYLSIDTNPDDIDDYTDEEAIVGIYMVHSLLELPESVINDMGQTRAMDGAQSYSNDKFNVKWRYHPDNGLEITYTLK